MVLGAPVGYTAFVKEKLQKRVEKVQSVVELLPLLKDPHSEFVLLRSCLSLPKIMFMLRAVDTTDHLEQLTNSEAASLASWAPISRISNGLSLLSRLPWVDLASAVPLTMLPSPTLCLFSLPNLSLMAC